MVFNLCLLGASTILFGKCEEGKFSFTIYNTSINISKLTGQPTIL